MYPAVRPTEAEFTDLDLQSIRNLVYKWTGINVSDRKKNMLASRLAKRLRHFELTRMSDYLQLVLSGRYPDEKQTFINLVTTNETYFFREVIHFEYLHNILRKKAASGKRLLLWSAACSTGEEAYSMAFTAAETLGINGDWKILASDINDDVLSRATEATYSMERMRDFPEEYLHKYCLRGKGSNRDHFRIGDAIRAKVSFSRINLTEIPDYLEKFDVIFLRNVLIYFDTAVRQKILELLEKHTKPGGYLVVSLTESLNRLKTGFRPVGESYFMLQEPAETPADESAVEFF